MDRGIRRKTKAESCQIKGSLLGNDTSSQYHWGEISGVILIVCTACSLLYKIISSASIVHQRVCLSDCSQGESVPCIPKAWREDFTDKSLCFFTRWSWFMRHKRCHCSSFDTLLKLATPMEHDKPASVDWIQKRPQHHATVRKNDAEPHQGNDILEIMPPLGPTLNNIHNST